MPLFDNTPFIGASGSELNWKIECDFLEEQDWACLAWMASSILPPFSAVWGVPTGGIPFADALREFAVPGVDTWLVADDVWTTGSSVGAFRRELIDRDGPIDTDTKLQRMQTSLTIVAFNRSGKDMPHKSYAVLSVHPDVMP